MGGWAVLSATYKLDLANKEVARILDVVRGVIGSYKVETSNPIPDQICQRCHRPMCSVYEPNKDTYFLCFSCGLK